MGFVETMREREQIAQLTHEDEFFEHLSEPRTGYIGFDPTAPSLHVGHLVQVMALRRWQQAGHKAIALVGGGTAAIGDPTGKTEMRQMLTLENLASNAQKIKNQLESFVDLTDPKKGKLVNNADWLFKLEYLPFLREIGPHFSVNRMLTAECFKQRLEKGLSFLEFNYMLLQSYDFLHLFRHENCTVQLGGDDQWSNILGGMELVRRLSRKQAFGVTLPLLTTPDGKKMGKTEKGAVWLDPNMTSPYDYFQYWRNVTDAMLVTCFRIFTDLPVDDIKDIAQSVTQGDAGAINAAKEELAYLATKMLHGAAEADKARETAKALFSGGPAAGNEPTVSIGRGAFGDGMNILDLLTASGVVASKSEARRLIQQGGLAFNGEKVEDIGYIVQAAALESHEGTPGALVKKGKKHYYRLVFSN